LSSSGKEASSVGDGSSGGPDKSLRYVGMEAFAGGFGFKL